MNFIINLIKVLASVAFIMLILYWLKIPSETAKYQVILSLAVSGSVFFFLHRYMEFIGFFQVPIMGLNKNSTPPSIWKCWVSYAG